MIRAALQSSHFLYRLETSAPASPATTMVPLSQYEMATRLSYLIWAAGPDDALLDAAGRGELSSREPVATKARTMLADPKARVAITDFYKQWLGTSRLDITTKSTTAFPAFTDAAREGMRLETPAFVEYVMWTGDHKLATLLTSPTTFVTSALAPIYGVTAPANSATVPKMVTLPANQGRSGVLTQAGFLAAQAHPDQTSPVLRGKFVRTNMMCQPPPMPPMDIDISVPDVGSGATARERFAVAPDGGEQLHGLPPDDGPDRARVRKLRRHRPIPDDRKRRHDRSVRRGPRLARRGHERQVHRRPASWRPSSRPAIRFATAWRLSGSGSRRGAPRSSPTAVR